MIHCSNACNLKPNVQALTIIDTHYLNSSKEWVRQLLYSLITASIEVKYLTLYHKLYKMKFYKINQLIKFKIKMKPLDFKNYFFKPPSTPLKDNLILDLMVRSRFSGPNILLIKNV